MFVLESSSRNLNQLQIKLTDVFLNKPWLCLFSDPAESSPVLVLVLVPDRTTTHLFVSSHNSWIRSFSGGSLSVQTPSDRFIRRCFCLERSSGTRGTGRVQLNRTFSLFFPAAVWFIYKSGLKNPEPHKAVTQFLCSVCLFQINIPVWTLTLDLVLFGPVLSALSSDFMQVWIPESTSFSWNSVCSETERPGSCWTCSWDQNLLVHVSPGSSPDSVLTAEEQQKNLNKLQGKTFICF